MRLACTNAVLAAVLLAGSACCFAQAPVATPPAFPSITPTPLSAQIIALTTAPGVVRAHWGVAVTEMDGTPIFGMNEGAYFRPASNAKLFTTAAAMHLLGPNSHVETALVSARADDAGTVQGDVTLVGNGDANLSARRIPYLSARQVAALPPCGSTCLAPLPLGPLLDLANDFKQKQHVKVVHGDIVGDDSAWPQEPYGADWSIDDAVWGYGAPVSALTVTDNQLDLTVSAGAKVGDPAVVALIPSLPYYSIDAHVTTVAADAKASVRIDRAPGSKVLRLVGTIAIGKPDKEEIAIEDPAEYAAVALKALLEADGIQVTGRARAVHSPSEDSQGFTAESHQPVPRMRLAPSWTEANIDYIGYPIRRQSVTLAEDVTVTLKVSQNLHAELMLRRLGAAYGEEGSSAQGARVVRQFLQNAGLDGDDFILYDGSGLSGHDLVTPRATAKLLAFAAAQRWFPLWKAALPIGGEDGSLASRFAKAPLKDHVFAKTGTLGESRALSGYVDCASGRTVIFSIMVDTHTPTSSADREAMDGIVAAIAAQL